MGRDAQHAGLGPTRRRSRDGARRGTLPEPGREAGLPPRPVVRSDRRPDAGRAPGRHRPDAPGPRAGRPPRPRRRPHRHGPPSHPRDGQPGRGRREGVVDVVLEPAAPGLCRSAGARARRPLDGPERRPRPDSCHTARAGVCRPRSVARARRSSAGDELARPRRSAGGARAPCRAPRQRRCRDRRDARGQALVGLSIRQPTEAGGPARPPPSTRPRARGSAGSISKEDEHVARFVAQKTGRGAQAIQVRARGREGDHQVRGPRRRPERRREARRGSEDRSVSRRATCRAPSSKARRARHREDSHAAHARRACCPPRPQIRGAARQARGSRRRARPPRPSEPPAGGRAGCGNEGERARRHRVGPPPRPSRDDWTGLHPSAELRLP